MRGRLTALLLLLATAASAQTTTTRTDRLIASTQAIVGGTSLGANTLNVTGTLGVSGAATVGGTLGVTGATTLTGLLNANGGLAVDSTAFTVADTSGNTSIAGTLGVTGATTLAATSISGGSNNPLTIYDTRAAAAGVGGGLNFFGNYTGTSSTVAAHIYAAKSNATAGNWGFDLVFRTREHNSADVTERMRIASTGLTVNGALGVNGNTTLGDATSDTLTLTARLASDATPSTGYTRNLGQIGLKYLSIHAAELQVDTLVAQDVLSTIGGRILVLPTTTLTSDLAAASALTITSGMVTASGLGGSNINVCAVNGVDSGEATCWNTDSATAGATLTVDLGAGNEQFIARGRIYAQGTSAAVWRLERSADGSSWTTVCTLASLVAGWNNCYGTGSEGSAVRYARWYLTNTPGAGAWQTEFQVFPHAVVYVAHNQMAPGDVVYAEGGGQVEFFHVAGGPNDSGPYRYYLVRDLDQTGANAWYAGDALANTGAAGDGFIDLYSVRGVASGGYGPTIVGHERLSASYADWEPRWAIGNLRGLYGYSADTYGAAFGDDDANNLTVDATNGIRMRSGTTVLGQWSGTTLTLGQPLTANNTGQLVIDSDSIDLKWRNNSGATTTMLEVTNNGGVGWVRTNGSFEATTDIRTPTLHYASGSITLQTTNAGSGIIFSTVGGSVRPASDNTLPLGNSTYQWSAVYSEAYYVGTTAGVSGTCASVTVVNGIVTGCTP